MRKTALLACTILLLQQTHAQDGYGYSKPDSAKLAKEASEIPKLIPLEFSEVVKADSVSKEDIYSRARAFIAIAYKNANAVLQMDDKQAGIIIGKGIFKSRLTPSAYNGNVEYTLKIEIKEGRFRVSITSFTQTLPDVKGVTIFGGTLTTDEFYPYTIPVFGKKGYNKMWVQIKAQAMDEFTYLVKELSTAVKSGIGKKDDF